LRIRKVGKNKEKKLLNSPRRRGEKEDVKKEKGRGGRTQRCY
jgi:hypothetical protein